MDWQRRTFAGARRTFVVLSRPMLEHFAHEGPWILVSITDPGKEPARVPGAPGLVDVLRLSFDDVRASAGGRRRSERPCEARDADAVIRFVGAHADVPTIVVQCEGGISRSMGCAAALSKWLNGEDVWFFERGAPNELVYALVHAAAQRTEGHRAWWETATPQERAQAFREWAASHRDGPDLPDEAVSREGIYDG